MCFKKVANLAKWLWHIWKTSLGLPQICDCFFQRRRGQWAPNGPNTTSFCSKENGHTKCSGFGKANLAGMLPSKPKKNLEHTPHASKTPNGRRHGAKHPPNDHWLAVGRISFWRSRLRAYFFRDTFGGKSQKLWVFPEHVYDDRLRTT